jgi:hypothetical protein
MEGTMEGEEKAPAPAEEQAAPADDRHHEPHEHARSRVLLGIGAVLVVIGVGTFVWSQWGEEIQEACFGEKGACTIEMPEEDVAFESDAFDDMAP